MRFCTSCQLTAIVSMLLCMAPAAMPLTADPQESCAGIGLQGNAASLIQQARRVPENRMLANRFGLEPEETLNKLAAHGQESPLLHAEDDVAEARKMMQKNLESPSALPYHFTNFDYKSYTVVQGSQHAQANWVDDTLGKKEGLFVVESGAFDGEEFSNSIALETLRKWNCLLVEPNPSAQKAILSKHRHCHLLKGAFSAGESLFSTNTLFMAGGLGGFNDTIDDSLRGRAEDAVAHSQTIDGDRTSFSGEMVEVPTFRFDFVMSELGVKTVDYWSLDTEGSEASILQNTDFNKVEVGLLTVEHNNIESQRTAIHDVMKSKGFVRVKALGPDDCYANPKYFKAHNLKSIELVEMPIS